MLSSCSSLIDPDSQPANTFDILRNDERILFPVSEAGYRWKIEPNGCEFTLRCEAEDTPEHNHGPLLEVTLILKNEPRLVAGTEWTNQPAYVEDPELGWLTNYYEWTHEGFENFSLKILNISGEGVLTCRLIGMVSLNPDRMDQVPVSVVADFKHDETVRRGVG
ncbi:MAG: hypothetical protein ACI8UO_004453 [Verrucomicrobiales bacterium]|jgi:hypothetical protein